MLSEDLSTVFMGLDTPILRSAQATTVPRRGSETMAFGRRPLSSRRAAGVGQRVAASSVHNMNDTRLICELHLNSRSRATAPDVPSASDVVWGRLLLGSQSSLVRDLLSWKDVEMNSRWTLAEL